MVRKTKEQALATREMILDAAECEFQRRGVSATSLQQIAEAAGLTRGAIYWHFQDKADLFDAMMQRVELPFQSILQGAGASPMTDPVGLLRQTMDAAFRRLASDAQVRRVFEISLLKVEYVDELQAQQDRRLAARDAMLDDLEPLFAAAVSQGRIRGEMPARDAARGLQMLVFGVLYNWLLDPAAFELQADGLRLVDVYLRGLEAARAPAACTDPVQKD